MINLSVQHLHFISDKNVIKYYFCFYETKNILYEWLNDIFGIDEDSFRIDFDTSVCVQIHVPDDSIFVMIRTHVNMLRNSLKNDRS